MPQAATTIIATTPASTTRVCVIFIGLGPQERNLRAAPLPGGAHVLLYLCMPESAQRRDTARTRRQEWEIRENQFPQSSSPRTDADGPERAQKEGPGRGRRKARTTHGCQRFSL